MTRHLTARSAVYGPSTVPAGAVTVPPAEPLWEAEELFPPAPPAPPRPLVPAAVPAEGTVVEPAAPASPTVVLETVPEYDRAPPAALAAAALPLDWIVPLFWRLPWQKNRNPAVTMVVAAG